MKKTKRVYLEDILKKSKCCNAKIKISTSEDFGGDIGTSCYICTKCNKPTDSK